MSVASADEPLLYFIQMPDGNVEHLAGLETLPEDTGQRHLFCYSCTTCLQYAAGASYVQCPQCRQMNAVLVGTQNGGRTINMLCANCMTGNLAPWGTTFVRCGTCATVSCVSHVYQPNR
mmetsp:Transcript_5145/g.11356  ORF Transcript_5145/g.11356 Transcript_5145/m.11356 type:complete len:119 (+) Transcript_5145:64-420(+)